MNSIVFKKFKFLAEVKSIIFKKSSNFLVKLNSIVFKKIQTFISLKWIVLFSKKIKFLAHLQVELRQIVLCCCIVFQKMICFFYKDHIVLYCIQNKLKIRKITCVFKKIALHCIVLKKIKFLGFLLIELKLIVLLHCIPNFFF